MKNFLSKLLCVKVSLLEIYLDSEMHYGISVFSVTIGEWLPSKSLFTVIYDTFGCRFYIDILFFNFRIDV